MTEQGAPPPDDYNPIFEVLVDSPGSDHGRLQGLVAYGLYKGAKREWASDIRRREGRGPNENELAAYIATWTESRLGGVRGEAAQILAAYADYVVSEEQPRILRNALKGSFSRAFWPSFWATILFAVLVVALGAILAAQDIDILGAASRALAR